MSLPERKKIRACGKNGEVVPIRVKNLTEAEKRLLNRVFDRIDESLERCDDIEWVDDPFRNALRDASGGVAFVTTGEKSVAVCAMTDHPVVILNRALLGAGMDFDEACATILHQLLHVVGSDGAEVDLTSMDEAKHDMLCYALLGMDIPGSHWAFTKYPNLFDELAGADDDGNEE